MGYICNEDTESQHEGWVAMTYADGAVSAGVSTARGHYVTGFDAWAGEQANEAYLRPDTEIVGWLPRCQCGWVGIELHNANGAWAGEPNDDQEDLLMDQWRLHLRAELPGAYANRALGL